MERDEPILAVESEPEISESSWKDFALPHLVVRDRFLTAAVTREICRFI